MTAFDLKFARLDGALTQGARFNSSVSKVQLKSAVAGAPAVLIPIGESLAKMRREIADYLGEKVYVPGRLSTAIAQLVDDIEQRQERLGAYIGDSSDLARRRLSRPLRELGSTLKASGASFVVFEPGQDLEFDMLSVLMNALAREGANAFAFILPQVMASSKSGAGIVSARQRSLPEGRWMNLNEARDGLRTGLHERAKSGISNRLSHLERTRELVLGFVWVAAHARLQWRAFGRESASFDTRTDLYDGARRKGESVADAISRVIMEQAEYVERHHIFIRDDLYTPDTASRIAGQIGGQRTSIEMSIYPNRGDGAAEFYAVSGDGDSELWNVLRRMQ